MSYICEQILPQLDKILTSKDDSPIKLELFKVFAELCTHSGALTDPRKKLEQVYQQLIVSVLWKLLMPLALTI